MPSDADVSLNTDQRSPPPVTVVVTSPPWARDEPPSPKEKIGSPTQEAQSTESHIISDTSSLQSNRLPSDSASRWWSFASRARQESFALLSHSTKPEKKSVPDISKSWMPPSLSMHGGSASIRQNKGKEPDGYFPHLPVSLPTPTQLPDTVSLSQTAEPGWDIPWSSPSQPSAQGPSSQVRRGSPDRSEQELTTTHISKWSRRTKKMRSFILANTYAPLLFRFINIAFTTAALGMAIRIRNIEIKNNVMGAVGSSPTVVIIFAPLTLVHVMVAIYLEYFGRPLGLWRTSAKLAHTLSEVLFICAWSAALSLCFDNFFTSLIPCASPSSTSWYNHLPRPPSDIPGFEDSLGDRICEHQLSLICLVGVGLTAYCTNLVINLYRVFEIVKYRPNAASLVAIANRVMPKASRIRHSVHRPSIKLRKEANNATVDVLMKSDISAEDIPVEQPISEPVVRTKKAKQIERHEAFLQKLEPSPRHFSKSHERRMKRKAREQLAGNMDDLQTAIASLDKAGSQSVEKPSPSIPINSGEVKPKAGSSIGKIGKGPSSTLSKSRRKRQLELERLRYPFILANPDFASNPFQTIRRHAQNTLIARERELPS